ncbi:MAG: nucleotidyl transferase AbiEii/AbiGii toxin family protein [Candidatus Thermoplasmatota archaeon]|nr:nucleotidyl transferase AbiEii/AbiGii toxin family protein [Candidatus Thermoplasmatota archaeon]MCL5963879.1 nucleotidyl transferase AbiEii/AbiGii toxin family protein [Candidatus Thermoplasmatota archaeon]
MIDEFTLFSFSNYFADERQLEKDYLLNFMLKMLSLNRISNYLDFKGGTALYMLYGLDRFSEDLDFSYIINNNSISDEIDELMNPVISNFNLSYKISKNRGNIIIRNEKKDITNIRIELFVEGPLFGKNRVRHKIKIDITTRNDIVVKPDVARFTSKYYDIGTMLIYSMPLQEILTEKLSAIIERDETRDLYDAYFIILYKKTDYDEGMLTKKLELRGLKFDKKVLLRKISNVEESRWKEELSYIIRDLPKLDEIKEFLINTIK